MSPGESQPDAMHDALNPRPRVSIGMPVRNGAKFIREAIDSILAQTFSDWELIVCDNASTDTTEQIVREYARSDARIHYHRNPRDIGPAGNYNLCFTLSRGEYFRWHAHDDVIEPAYLAESVKALDDDPSLVVAYPRTAIIGERGEFIEDYRMPLRTNSASAAVRFASLVMVNHRQHRAVEIFGLMRADALRRTPLQERYARGDSVLLVRMALRGRFAELEPRLFLSRNHPAQSMQMLPSRLRNSEGKPRYSAMLGTGPLPPPEWWDSSLKNRVTFPEWRLMHEYFATIGSAPIGAIQKLKCLGVMGIWVILNVPKLVRDLIVALEQIFDRGMDRFRPRGIKTPKSV